MDSIISTFHIDWKIIIAQIINFGAVLAVLYFYALKPLQKLMSERQEKIEKGVKDAKENQAVLEKTEAEYKKVVERAKIEAEAIFQEGKKEALAKKTLMLQKANEEVALMIENGKKSLESEKVKMVNEAKKDIVSLSMQITEKLLSRKVDGDFDQQAIEELRNL